MVPSATVPGSFHPIDGGPLHALPLSRRGFVAGLATALVLGPSGVVRALAPSRPLDRTPLDDLFDEPGTLLRLRGERAAITARVRSVEERAPAGPFRQVSMLLESDEAIGQDVLEVEHPERGRCPLLVVPVVHPADAPGATMVRRGRFAYQISFSRDERA